MRESGEGGPPQAIPPSAFGIGRLFDRVREGVVVAEAQGRILSWNPSAERILGYTEAEAVGISVTDLVPTTSALGAAPGLFGLEPPFDERALLEVPLVRKDGREITAEVSLTPVQAEGVPGEHVLILLRDVTERVHLLQRLEAMNQGLRQANEALEAFSYVVSHDLKEPVRAIGALLRALEEDEGDRLTGDGLRLLEQCRSAGDRLDRLVGGLLSLSRASRLDLRGAQPVSLEAAFRGEQTGASFQALAQERGARVELEFDHPPPVRGTVGALAQVFGNLVANAIRHNPSQNPLVRVRAIPHEADASFVEVVVADDGPGFPEAVRERFEQGVPQPSPRGGGFGLLIVRRTVEALGGRMWLSAAPEGGAAVHLLLPAA